MFKLKSFKHKGARSASQRITKPKIEYLCLSPDIISWLIQDLIGFIDELAKRDELRKIKDFINPELEITEITDRITKSGGKALLFENTGTDFPLLINAYGSDKRMAMAIGRTGLDDVGKEIDELFENISDSSGTFLKKISRTTGTDTAGRDHAIQKQKQGHLPAGYIQ